MAVKLARHAGHGAYQGRSEMGAGSILGVYTPPTLALGREGAAGWHE